MLARRKVGRAFVYAPTEPRDAMRRAALRELLDGYFDGSEEELIRFLRPQGQALSAAAGAATALAASPAAQSADERVDTVLL
jgi:predicted transcriptional regulator